MGSWGDPAERTAVAPSTLRNLIQIILAEGEVDAKK